MYSVGTAPPAMNTMSPGRRSHSISALVSLAAARHRRGLLQAHRDRRPSGRGMATAGLRAGADDRRRVEDVPYPGEPVLHGRLMTGQRTQPQRPRRRRGRAAVVAAGQGVRRVSPALADRARRRAARRRGARRRGDHRPPQPQRAARAGGRVSRGGWPGSSAAPTRRSPPSAGACARPASTERPADGSAGRDDPQHVERRDDAERQAGAADDDDVRRVMVGHQRGGTLEVGGLGERERCAGGDL
jgi:hypothetical protein